MSDLEIAIRRTLLDHIRLDTLIANLDLQVDFLLSENNETVIFEITQSPVIHLEERKS